MSTVIVIETELVRAGDPDFCRHGGQDGWQIHLAAALPSRIGVAIVSKVALQRGRDRDAVVAAEDNFAFAALDFKNVLAAVGGDGFHDERFRLLRHDARNQTARRGFRVGIRE